MFVSMHLLNDMLQQWFNYLEWDLTVINGSNNNHEGVNECLILIDIINVQ